MNIKISIQNVLISFISKLVKELMLEEMNEEERKFAKKAHSYF